MPLISAASYPRGGFDADGTDVRERGNCPFKVVPGKFPSSEVGECFLFDVLSNRHNPQVAVNDL